MIDGPTDRPGRGDEQRTEMATERTDLATERTEMANERTRLAWWRTGLTAFAVALAVGRLLPELSTDSGTWPYVVLGVAFAVYGIALFLHGTRRARETRRKLGVGADTESADRSLHALAGAGVALGVGTILVILFL